MVGALVIQTLTTTIYSIGIPPETTLLFKALVVTVVCLLQSPAFRAKVFQPRRSVGARRQRPPPAAVEPHVGGARHEHRSRIAPAAAALQRAAEVRPGARHARRCSS